MKLAALHPRQIMVALDRIDAAAPSWQMSRPQALRRTFIVLASVSISLLILHYARYATNFHAVLQWLGDLHGVDLRQQLREAGWLELGGYLWWTSCHLFTFIVIPWLVIRFMFREHICDFGWRWNHVSEHWRGYLLLLSPILVFVGLVSIGEDFVRHYPFYQFAGRSWLDLLVWELLYMSQFVFLEFFFRGYMLNALRPAIGANAVWVMCVPYLMIHFPKLWLEATGAILFGLFLGILALQSRSIWGGVLVHAGVALSMDMAALIRKGQVPGSFFPF